MAQATLSADQLMGDRAMTDEELSHRWDRYLNKVTSMRTIPLSTDQYAQFKSQHHISLDPAPRTAYDAMMGALTPEVVKGLDPNSLASLKNSLDSMRAEMPDLMKDFNLTSPIPSGAVAFDLEAP